jgi:hypothetical protein
MGKITTQDLKFIDNYLKKSEIFYDDIRMELTDHIASAVEEKMLIENSNFYDAFKSYMIENKKELIKKFSGSGLKSFEPVKSFGLFLTKPISLFLLFFFSCILFIFEEVVNKELFVLDFYLFWMGFIILFGLSHQIFFGLIKKKRFFAIEQTFFVLLIFQYMLNFSVNSSQTSTTKTFYYYCLFVFLTAVFLLFYFNRIQKYYNNKHIWDQK